MGLWQLVCDDVSYVHTDETKHLRLQRDGNCAYNHDIFTRMAAGAEMNNTLDEYWDIVKKTFATEGEAYIFYNKYARDKGFSARKQKVRHAKHSAQILFR